MKPHIIAIAGPSGAGKSELAGALARELGCPILSLDRYYQDLSALSLGERIRVNFDAPTAIDQRLLVRHVQELSQGHEIEQPIYDFATHRRVPETETLRANTFLILEGLFALYWPELRELAETKIFVDAEDAVCLARRQQRDVVERGRNTESVISQFKETVQPMAARYVRPSKAYADLRLSGEEELDRILGVAIEYIRTHSPGSMNAEPAAN